MFVHHCLHLAILSGECAVIAGGVSIGVKSAVNYFLVLLIVYPRVRTSHLPESAATALVGESFCSLFWFLLYWQAIENPA